MTQPPTYARVAAALRASRLGTQPSDLHGSATGYLCAGGQLGADDWLDRLELSPGEGAAARDEVLAGVRAAAIAQFEQAPVRVEPLLPDAAAPLHEHAQALVEWCRGFLGGYGLGVQHTGLSEQARELLADFGTIASSHLEVEGGASDEEAFDDVLDFVRNAAAALWREGEQRRPSPRSLH